jgi:hypothetical protein
MIKELVMLKEIQALDTDIISLMVKADSIPREISKYEQPCKDAQNEFERIKAELDASVKRRRSLEGAFEETTDRVAKLKARSAGIKTNKEYLAHKAEIEKVELEGRAVEDDILAAMESVEELQGRIKQSEAAYKNEKTNLEVKRAALEKEQAALKTDIDALNINRSEYLKSVDKGIYEQYKDFFRRKKNLAVVRAENAICTGCNMNMPPQLYVEVMKNDKLLTCPQCGRFLFYDPAETPDDV